MAGYHNSSLAAEGACKLNIRTSSATAGLVVIHMAGHHLFELLDTTCAVLLTGSRCALQLFHNNDGGFLFAGVAANACCLAEDAGLMLCLQWIPSDGGISGNETADTLAASAHKLVNLCL